MGRRLDKLHNRIVLARWGVADWAHRSLPKFLGIFCMPVMYWAIKEVHREMLEEGSHDYRFKNEIMEYQKQREAYYWTSQLRKGDGRSSTDPAIFDSNAGGSWH